MTAPTTLAAAACIGSSRTFDFAVEGNPAAIKHAKEICTACDLRAACLEGALERRERWGVWGGLSKPERDVLLAERDAATFMQEPPPTERHGRSCATSGRCDCAEGRAAHARYMRERRAESGCHTRVDRESGPFEQLALEVE